MMTLSFRYSIVWLVFFLCCLFFPYFFKEKNIDFYWSYDDHDVFFSVFVIKLINLPTSLIIAVQRWTEERRKKNKKNSLNNLYIHGLMHNHYFKMNKINVKKLRKIWMD